MLPIPTRVAIVAFTLMLPASSQAATFTFCPKWKVLTTDSGRTITTLDGQIISEDYWATDAPQLQTAHGTLFTVQRPGLNGGLPLLFRADPSTGCATLKDTAGTQNYLLRVYTVATNLDHNTVRIVDPNGSPYFFDVAVQVASGTTVDVPVPADPSPSTDQQAIATLAAVSAFAAHRSSFGAAGKQIDIIEGTASSAHDGSGVDLTQLARGYIRISIKKPTPDAPSDHRSMKFIVTHEMGHAWLLLQHGSAEPNVGLDYDASTDGDPSVDEECDDGGGPTYGIDTLEYTSVGFREGAAHFYAARVWNDPEGEGVFTWFAENDGRSLARLDDPYTGGGRTFQRCLTKDRPLEILCANNVTTNEDWLRFFWAWHTTAGVTTPMLRDVYERTLDNGGLLQGNYFTKLSGAVQQLADGSQQSAFMAIADWHGVSSGQNSRCQ